MRRNRDNTQRGFTLIEMLIATAIVLVGLVAVAQLVPTSVLLNSNNRNDAAALVFAQRELEALRELPLPTMLAQATFSDPQGVTCPAGTTCYAGNPAQAGQVVGSPVVVSNGAPLIDYSAAPVSGYSFTYTDPNDPSRATYDVRWAVITTVNGTTTTGRRILVGVFRRGMRTPSYPITVDTLVSR